MNHNYNFDFDFLQFGKLRQNFSEVADFVTIYIAEVAHSYITTAMIVLIIIVPRLIQRREVTSELEGRAATMTLTPMPTLRTGLRMMMGATKVPIVENLNFKNDLKQEQAERCHHAERGGWRGSQRLQNSGHFDFENDHLNI